MIAIVNYGVGNLYSLQCSLRHIGADCIVTADPAELQCADGIILPGVGAFGDAISKLRQTGLDKAVREQASAGKPLLGICLGMQLLYESSDEYGAHKGLGLFRGNIKSIRQALRESGEPDTDAIKVPHMGWNSLRLHGGSPLLRHTKEGGYVYYVHSFYAAITDETVASSRYGPVEVTGAVQRGNVFGTQFHPEKSGAVGLGILRGFVSIVN